MDIQNQTVIPVENPINGKVLYEINDNPENVASYYKIADEVQQKIQAMSIKERIAEVDKINQYVLDHSDFILDCIIAETGKARTDAFAAEVFEVGDVIDVYKKLAPKLLKDKNIDMPVFLMGKKCKQYFEPLGTVLVITPWNFPFYQVIVPSLLSFLAGNATIAKPSEVTPLKPLWDHFFANSGFMKNAIQVVFGGKQVGAALIQQRPDKIHFTGSVKSGKIIGKLAAEQLIPVDLELGGKDASIVFDDINMERTVNGVMWGAFTNAGQNCTGIERLYVQDTIYDKFVNELVNKTKKLRTSHIDRDTKSPEDCDMGTMTAPFQVAIVEEHIEDALAKGAKLLCGGITEKGSMHMLPTILENCNHTMKIASEETFGPTVAIMKFKTEAEAIALANDSIYGLGGSVWTKDLARGERVARAIKTGNFCINNHMINEANPYLPFGGTKDSGIGRFKGEEGILTFCNHKSVLIDKMSSIIEPHWYPFTNTKAQLLRNLMDSWFQKSRNYIKFAINGLKIDSIGTKEQIK
ncbi:MAG TPA: aldehyde dehydrogenase family protein [Chitinophagales bacterium]|nr:aldehyde dehydrogenase family protein [Chitinophagales bacterium]HNI00836.1 aldehyde dehydrogenase family protein [Chitinophagales bacterium]HNO47377.1 aldehyde dehydrogenase family protein [Chitinophagales bacterium]